jgi:DNA-binding transcriptional ArsR family regulator
LRAGAASTTIQTIRCRGVKIATQTRSLPHPLPDDLAELIARRFRAISEPMRVRLLDRLRDGEACVNDLAAQLEASQQNVSKHLSVLADVGILGRRKDGNRVYYRIVDEGVLGLCEQVCGSVQAQLAALAAMIDGADR